MKLRITLIFLLLTQFSVYSAEMQCAIVIKNAKEKHVDEIEAFTRSIVFNDLKPIILEGYADNPLVSAGHTDVLLNEWLGMQNMKCNHICSEDTIKADERLIIARGKDKKEIVGVCQFERTTIDEIRHVFIRFVGVKEHMRKQGLGTRLLNETTNAFDDVEVCSLMTLAHANDVVHQWYEKRGFNNAGLETIDPRVPNSHNLYVKNLKTE